MELISGDDGSEEAELFVVVLELVAFARLSYCAYIISVILKCFKSFNVMSY